MVIEKEIVIDKDIASAWQLLGPGFADAYKWASAVHHSEGRGDSFNGASCSERGCATTMGGIKEKLLSYNESTHSLSYQLTQGMPSVVNYATNTWKLTAMANNKTLLQIRMDIALGGLLGRLMQPIMKMQLSGIGNSLVRDFKYYVEHGAPGPEKLKAIRKFPKQQNGVKKLSVG